MTRTPLAMRPAGRIAGAPSGPAWADLGTRAGTSAAARFYCSLFGWSVVAHHRPLDDRVGHWTFRQGGTDVGGLAPAREATWTVYMAVSDVDAMARAVADNGGAVLVGPVNVDAGRMVVCADPFGASFAMWQPDPDTPVDTGDRDGASPSFQLACPDVEGATAFYGAVFGWRSVTTRPARGAAYAECFCPGTDRPVARMVEMDERWPADVPACWMLHLEVSDTDRTAARAAELGGLVPVPPFDLPNVGRLAVLNDPERAVFSVLEAA